MAAIIRNNVLFSIQIFIWDMTILDLWSSRLSSMMQFISDGNVEWLFSATLTWLKARWRKYNVGNPLTSPDSCRLLPVFQSAMLPSGLEISVIWCELHNPFSMSQSSWMLCKSLRVTNSLDGKSRHWYKRLYMAHTCFDKSMFVILLHTSRELIR